MEAHRKLSDQVFESQFRDCILDPLLFTHEAHLRLAWIHIRKYGVETACESICGQIKAYDQIHGDGTKFNKTMTVAAIMVVNHFILKSKSNSFAEFIGEFPRLKSNFMDLILAHHSAETFKSGRSKEIYVEPDLMAFD